jgi:hypothetical protein
MRRRWPEEEEEREEEGEEEEEEREEEEEEEDGGGWGEGGCPDPNFRVGNRYTFLKLLNWKSVQIQFIVPFTGPSPGLQPFGS